MRPGIFSKTPSAGPKNRSSASGTSLTSGAGACVAERLKAGAIQPAPLCRIATGRESDPQKPVIQSRPSALDPASNLPAYGLIREKEAQVGGSGESAPSGPAQHAGICFLFLPFPFSILGMLANQAPARTHLQPRRVLARWLTRSVSLNLPRTLDFRDWASRSPSCDSILRRRRRPTFR